MRRPWHPQLRARPALTEGPAEPSGPDEEAFAARADSAFVAPDASLRRVRGRVLAEFQTTPTQVAASAARRHSRPRFLPVAASIALAVVAIALVAANTAPGRPFYDLRLEVETLTLPREGTAARWSADLARLDQRLAEAHAAATAGDSPGVAAALGAYAGELDAVLVDARAPAADPSELATRLARQQADLGGLAGVSPDASAAVQGAADQVDRAQQALATPTPTLHARPTPSPVTHGNGNGNGNNGNGNNGKNGNGNGHNGNGNNGAGKSHKP